VDEFDSKRDVALPHRKIIHIDMDAFYASVEQRDNPELRGKAVPVGGSEERGVVAAASYEARKFGVRSAMASVTAKRQCPELIFVEPRFEVYKAISLQIREIFAEHTPIIEPLSLDEAYLDVTENIHGIPLARDIALRIREKIKVQTGLNASAGISYNKFLAKLASDHRKPNGQYVISPEMGPTFVETLPVERFHGVGPVTAEKFNALGIYTGLDIRAQSMTFLQEHFGKAGAYYYWISRGIDDRPVRANRIRKSVGAENTFSSDLSDFDDLVAELEPLVEKVWAYCDSTGSRGRTVTLKLKFFDFEMITRSRSVPSPVSTCDDLERLVVDLLQVEMPLPKPTAIHAAIPEVVAIDRRNMNMWEDDAARGAIVATGRRKLIFSGLLTEACVTFPVLSARAAGYEVHVVGDACGGLTPVSHDLAMRRMEAAGAKPTSWIQVLLELQRDWTRHETYDGARAIVEAHGGGYGIGLAYARDMIKPA
jgi:DNA polymerase IV